MFCSGADYTTKYLPTFPPLAEGVTGSSSLNNVTQCRLVRNAVFTKLEFEGSLSPRGVTPGSYATYS